MNYFMWNSSLNFIFQNCDKPYKLLTYWHQMIVTCYIKSYVGWNIMFFDIKNTYHWLLGIKMFALYMRYRGKRKWKNHLSQFSYLNWLISGNRYICLKLSIANSGRSAGVFPRWCNGCVNFVPSAVRKFMLPTKENKISHQ